MDTTYISRVDGPRAKGWQVRIERMLKPGIPYEIEEEEREGIRFLLDFHQRYAPLVHDVARTVSNVQALGTCASYDCYVERPKGLGSKEPCGCLANSHKTRGLMYMFRELKRALADANAP